MRRQHVGKGGAGLRKERGSDGQRPWEAWHPAGPGRWTGLRWAPSPGVTRLPGA